MKRILSGLILLTVPLSLIACGGSDDTGNSLMASAGKVAPQLSMTTGLTYTDHTAIPAAVKLPLTGFLKFGCHTSDGMINECPKYGITVTDFNNPAYQLDGGSFMGMIKGFAMKFDDVFVGDSFTTCGRANATERAPTFTGGTGLIFGYNGGFTATLGCTGKAEYAAGDAPYMTYSKTADKETFITAQQNSSQQGSYVYQGYVRNVDSTPNLMAFNSASYGLSAGSTMSVRLMFMGNPTTNRIALKWFAGNSDGSMYNSVSVIGVGGRTEAGAVAGFYSLGITNYSASTTTSATLCVNNGTGQVVAGTSCTEALLGKWHDNTATADELKTYLGLNADDNTIAADWITKLTGGTKLTLAGDTATSNAQLPATIE